MSISKQTGKHSQSKHEKMSFNLKPPFDRMFTESKIKMESVKGAPMTKTEAIEQMINGFHTFLKLTEERAMRKHERS